jgi:hypothetical protein
LELSISKNFLAFTGGSTRFDQAEDRRLVTSIDVYELQNPAQTADADQRFMVAEYTLESRNEKASGLVTDLTTS